MLERITELLTQNNILNGNERFLPITIGISGTYIFSIEDKYVVKYAYLPKFDLIERERFQKEFNFYKFFSDKNIDFIPEVVFQTANDNEILILMKKYSPIKVEEWTEDLQKITMELCARINAIEISNFNDIFHENEQFQEIWNNTVGYTPDGTPLYKEDFPLSFAYQNWKNLQKYFSEHIDRSLLKEMYESFDEIDSYVNTPPIPDTLCQKDFNPNNFLKDGDRLLACDWGEVCIGKGIDSVAWFSRCGTDYGITINRDKLIEIYCEALFKYANIKVALNDLHKYINASEFIGAFRCGAKFFQATDINSVLNCYNAMANNYKFFREH